MKKLTCTILVGFTAFSLARGADAPPTPEAETKVAATSEAPTLELKNKSSFVMDESGRNPFWPIGWKPAPKSPTAATTEHTGPEISPNSFLVSSIVLDPGAKFAIVNGKTMQEGQVFGLQMGNQTYQITVKSIEDGRVVLARRDQEIFVPLRRR